MQYKSVLKIFALMGNAYLPHSALRFAKYFGTSAKFWLGLQDDFDLEEEGINKKSELDEIPKINTNAA